MNRLLYILFFLLCGGSVFFHTHSVNDGQIVSKWLLAETAACLWLLALSLRCLKADNRRKAGLNIHKYFITVLACCWMESVYGIIQALPIFHSAHSLPISGSFDNPAGFAACICADLPFVYPFLKSKRKAVKLTALFMACCMMAACCLSQSRTGMVAVIVVTGMIVFPYIPRFKYRNSLIAMLLAGVLSMGYLFKNLEILSGEVCYELRRYDEAISHFEKASYMCPVKFAPLYRCYTIYKELGIKEKSDPLAEKILNKKVKIPSREIDHMRMEIRIDRVNEQSTNQ